MKKAYLLLAITLTVSLTSLRLFAHEGHEDGDKEELAATATQKITGEVVDMVCYIDHKATGEKHATCARKCIASGLPVGLKSGDGKTYLLVGEHLPLNAELAQYAGKKITVEGKVASRDGVYLLENAVIQK